MIRIKILKTILGMYEILLIPFIIFISIISRFFPKKYDIGLGPIPMINNVYHKRALELYGYKTETFVAELYYVTDQFDKKFIYKKRISNYIFIKIMHIDYFFSIFRYKCLYLYFNGGCLRSSIVLWRLEPFFLRLAGIKIVVMPYGGDVSKLDRTPNLYYRHALVMDYPLYKFRNAIIEKQIELWSEYSHHVIAGCDWVDYMHHWDTLMVSHFSIDVNMCRSGEKRKLKNNKTFRILHAPNHRLIKGTSFIIEAVEALQDEGEDVELKLLEKVSNEVVLSEIQKADLVIDQLVIGWYAMFTIESLCLGTPVVCYLREDLLGLYKTANLLKEDEPPIINSSPKSLINDLRNVLHDQEYLKKLSKQGSLYVKNHHSVEYIGSIFDGINRRIGLLPSQADE